MTFTILGYNGKPHTGRGRAVVEAGNGTVIVELLTRDLGGFGTYHKGMLLRIYKNEIHERSFGESPVRRHGVPSVERTVDATARRKAG